MGKESPLGLLLTEDILQFVKLCHYLVSFAAAYLTNDVITVKRIYQAELYCDDRSMVFIRSPAPYKRYTEWT